MDIYRHKKIIENSDNFHLPLKYRVEISRYLGENRINKVFLECCKASYLEFEIDDKIIKEVLKLAEESLYQNRKINFEDYLTKYQNYLEQINKKYVSGVAISTLSLLKNLTYDASLIIDIDNYKGEDDNEYDPEEWNSDFISSNLYSGGNPFIKYGSSIKRKEFWFRYLDIIDFIINNNKPMFKIDDIDDIDDIEFLKRNDSISNDIDLKLKQVIKLVENDIKENVTYEKIVIEGEILKAGKSMRAYYISCNKKIKIPLTFFLYSGEKSSVFLMQQIKDNMYIEKKDKGAWFSYKIESKGDYKCYFNYDNNKLIPSNKQNPDVFLAEFESYPRINEYTPKWWRDILKNYNIQYL